jgi:hypothetical protein
LEIIDVNYKEPIGFEILPHCPNNGSSQVPLEMFVKLYQIIQHYNPEKAWSNI